MIRATTPTHKFTLPFNYTQYVQKILITYSQKGNIVLEKNENDVQIDGNIVSYKLTQEETKLFSNGDVRVQVRVLTIDNDALASKEQTVHIDNVLNDEVL
jgi:hypothetical protein